MTPIASYSGFAAVRRTRRIIAVAVTIFLIACMVFARAALPARLLSSVSASSTAPATGYVAGVLDNRLAIYIAGQDKPALITDIDIRTLPNADQAALRAGLPIASDEALAHLLEDYGS